MNQIVNGKNDHIEHCEIKKKLDYYVENDCVPNILFNGPYNSGKKCLLNYLINSIYKNVEQDKRSEYIFIINCAFGKGIQLIRNELKFFAKTHIGKVTDKQYFFKSVVLLNAEKLTIDAQSALRRCIEIFSKSTRFFIVTHNKSSILYPIISRFSEIYVQREKYNEQPTLEKDKVALIRDVLHKIKNDTKEVVSVNQLYDKNISSLDLIQYIQKKIKEPYNKYKFLNYIDKQRKYIHDERMIMHLIVGDYKLRFLNSK